MPPRAKPSSLVFEDLDLDKALGPAGQGRANHLNQQLVDMTHLEAGSVPPTGRKRVVSHALSNVGASVYKISLESWRVMRSQTICGATPSATNCRLEIPWTFSDAASQSDHELIEAGEIRYVSIAPDFRLQATSMGYELGDKLDASKSRNAGASFIEKVNFLNGLRKLQA